MLERGRVFARRVFTLRYLAAGVLVFGEAVGEGLATGLTLAAGVAVVLAPATGDEAGMGVPALGVVELFSGSQAAKNITADRTRTSNAARLNGLGLLIVIDVASFQ
jgi:hypothetical protein